MMLFDKVKDNLQKTKFTQKELILNYLGCYYGCFYDSQGQKQHFFEVNTLREMKNQLDVLMLANDAEPYSNELGTEELKQRYMKLLSYLYNSFLQDRLTDREERALFEKWLKMSVSRRSREIFEHIHERRKKLDKEERGYLDPKDSRSYSYGGLMQDLYWASRENDPFRADGRKIFSKEMIWCILASYSVVLPRLVRRAQNYEEMKPYQEAYNEVKGIIGTSVAGLWANEILYTEFVLEKTSISMKGIKGEKDPTRGQIGSVSMNRFDNVLFGIVDFTKEEFEAARDQTNVADGNPFKRFIQNAELIGMLFTNVREIKREKKDFSYQYQFKIGSYWSDEAKGMERRLYPETEYACFNIFNFVVNSFCWEEYFRNLHDDLQAVLLKYYGENSDYTENDIREAIEKCSIKAEFECWSKGNDNTKRRLALPIQHMDMCYNILKHQHKGEDNLLPTMAKTSDFLKCCQTVYRSFIESLGSQDSFYGEVCGTSFRKDFAQNPFVIRILNPDDILEELFEKLADVLVSDVIGMVSPLDKVPAKDRRIPQKSDDDFERKNETLLEMLKKVFGDSIVQTEENGLNGSSEDSSEKQYLNQNPADLLDGDEDDDVDGDVILLTSGEDEKEAVPEKSEASQEEEGQMSLYKEG